MYDGTGSLISYENGEVTLGIIVDNAWHRRWTEEHSLSLVVWNDGSVSKLRRHRSDRTERQRTQILIQED